VHIDATSATCLRLDRAFANGPPEALLPSCDLAEITATGDMQLCLPPDTRDDLRSTGWVEVRRSCLRVRGARRAAEAEILWRILLCAYEFATGAPDRTLPRADDTATHRLITTWSAPAETGTTI
jgi:hypothetical protein